MIKRNSTSYNLLLLLEKAVEVGTTLADFIDNPNKFNWSGFRTNLNYSTTYKAIQRLKQKGYLMTKKEEKVIIIKLTKTGQRELDLIKIFEEKPWDNKWRIVIFDVPEEQRNLRNALRYRLKEWQFQQLQKSVWVSKKDIIKELKVFLREMGIENWVKVFVASEA